MDTKLKNNETQHKKRTLLLIFFLIYCFSFTILLAYGSKNFETSTSYDSKYEYNQNDYWRKSRYINEQGVRYVKNLNRFYIYYHNYENLEGIEKIREQDIVEELVYMQQHFSASLLTFLQEFNPNIVADSLLAQYNALRNYDDSSWLDTTTNGVYFVENFIENDTHISLREETLAFERVQEYDYLDIINAVREFQSDIFIAPEALQEKIIAQKDENYNDIKNYLQTNNEFEYYLYTDTQIYTNVKRPMDILGDNLIIQEDKLKQYALFYKDIREITDYFNGLPLNESFENNNIQGYFFIPSTVDSSAIVYEEIENVNTLREISKKIEGYTKYFAIFSIAFSIVVFLYCFLIRRQDISDTIKNTLQLLQKVPILIKLIFFVIGLFFIVTMFYETGHFMTISRGLWQLSNGYGGYTNTYLTSNLFFHCISIGLMSICIMYVAFLLLYFFKIFIQPKKIKEEVEIQFLWRLTQDIKLFASEGHTFAAFFMLAVLLVLFLVLSAFAGLFGINFLFRRYWALNFLFVISILFMLLIVMLVLIRNILSNFKYSYYFDQMLSGNIIDIDPGGMNTKALDKLMNLNEYIKEAVNERVKGEKLKSELITNVSHDLKTPLTTLINYIDLLKNDNISRQETQNYVSILEKKSQRLQYLVEDLFEISKLSNGQVQLQLSSVDIIALMKQTLGELAEKIEQSEIDFRFTANAESVYLLLDGNRIWRVFENLVNNILKYSQKHTRAYIHIEDKAHEVQIVFKNIANYELTHESHEFFERFIRGDQARSTEGSGLGLTIAKSIIDLHKGKIAIETDGDLFKVMIIFLKTETNKNPLDKE